MSKPTATNPPENDPQKPVFDYRINLVQGTVWANEHDGKVFFDTTVRRLYKEEDKKNWGQSHSFGRDDLLALAKVADVCHSWIIREQQKEEKGQ